MPQTYTVKQVADILGYSTNSIYTFLKEKRIQGVRVGKGRFRIPQSELDRLVPQSSRPRESTSPSSVAIVNNTTPIQTTMNQIGDDKFVDEELLDTNFFGFLHKGFSFPNIFDWFVGLSAVVSGVGLFLFNRGFQQPEADLFVTIVPTIRVILIACGLGILISDIMPKSRIWHRFFMLTLAVVGMFNAWMLWTGGDTGGAVVYFALSILVGINVFVHMGGIIALGIYQTILIVCIPFLLLLGTNDFNVFNFISSAGVSSNSIVIASFIGAFFLIVLFWVGYVQKNIYFWIASWITAILMIAASVLNAQLLYWSRAFFLLTLGYFIAVLPIWQSIQYNGSRRDRFIMHGMFGLVGSLLVLTLLVVQIMQIVLWKQNKVEFINKLTYGKTLLTSSIESVQSTLAAASINPNLLSAVASGDTDTLNSLSKTIYDSNKNIRRLVFLTANGDGLALYPVGLFDQINYAHREYFIRVRATREPYTSDLFESLADKANRKVMVVSVPLIGENGDFLGAMSGSVDILGLGLKVQAVSVGVRGERFIVMDREGKVAISIDPDQIGKSVPEGDMLYLGQSGEEDVQMGRFIDGTLGMIAYSSIPEFGWGISLRVPASSVYTLSLSAIFIVFSVVGSIAFITLLFMTSLHIHLRRTVKGGSP